MAKAVRAFLVVYLLGVAFLCTYVPYGRGYVNGVLRRRWVWWVTALWDVRSGVELDVHGVGINIVAWSALAGAAALLAWRKPSTRKRPGKGDHDDAPGGP